MDSATITTWLTEIAVVIKAQRDYLVQLDAAIGDGDHGTNMNRGFEAVVAAVAADGGSPPGRLLILAGKTLVSKVGGASGPLWGSAFRSAGRRLGEAPTFDAPALVAALDAGLAAVVDLGAAEAEEKEKIEKVQTNKKVS